MRKQEEDINKIIRGMYFHSVHLLFSLLLERKAGDPSISVEKKMF